jgi:hypothetical protein
MSPARALWRIVVLSRRLATALAMLAILSEAARADASPAESAKPGTGAATSPTPAPVPPSKTTVEPVDKDQVVAILGRAVSGPEGKEIGRLTDVLEIGGFMGVGMRSIAVHWTELHFTPSDPKAPIKLSLSLDTIKATPEYKGLDNKSAPVVTAAPAKPVPAH